MIRTILMASLILAASNCICAQDSKILEQKEGSITFAVDENLPKPENKYIVPDITEAQRLKDLGDTYYTLANSYIAASFWDTPMSTVDAPFFTGVVKAFADHRPICLTPDVIWMLISQAFSHEVNSDPERFRDKFVDFDGKVDLVVQTEKRLYDPEFDWTATIDGFAQKIDESTKNNVAKLLTADFSTTGTVERMASEIVLMETTKAFFEFIIEYLSCGIPSVTLNGTVQDWQSILDKTARLQEMGAGDWTSDLIPVLEQFVQAAGGNPDQAFWQDIVMKNTPMRLSGDGCSREKPTNLDGWFLKLMPFDKDGNRTPAKVPLTFADFPIQMSSVPVKYIERDPGGNVLSTVNLKLSGGIVGYTADVQTGCVSFPLGWTVRKSDEDASIDMIKEFSEFLSLRVRQIPEVLRSNSHYGCLTLEFTDENVEIPDWFYNLDIAFLEIRGKVSKQVKTQLTMFMGDKVRFRK